MVRRSSSSPPAPTVTNTAELPFSATPTHALRGVRFVASLTTAYHTSARLPAMFQHSSIAPLFAASAFVASLAAGCVNVGASAATPNAVPQPAPAATPATSVAAPAATLTAVAADQSAEPRPPAAPSSS